MTHKLDQASELRRAQEVAREILQDQLLYFVVYLRSRERHPRMRNACNHEATEILGGAFVIAHGVVTAHQRCQELNIAFGGQIFVQGYGLTDLASKQVSNEWRGRQLNVTETNVWLRSLGVTE